MSVKKILSIIMALAMVLTMASFPAFAEGEPVRLKYDSYTASVAPEGDWLPVSGMFDGDNTGSAYKPIRTLATTKLGSGDFNVYMDIEGETKYNLSSVKVGFTNTHYFSAFAIYGSNEAATAEAEWTLLANITSGTNGKTVSTCEFTHEGGYKYLRFEGYEISKKDEGVLTGGTPTFNTLSFFGTEYVDESATTVAYTVNYVDEAGNPVAESKTGEGIVGEGATEEAIKVPNYKFIGENAKETIVLDADPINNVIEFKYTAAQEASYTVKYLDEQGNPVADEKVVEGVYETDEITVNSVTVSGYFVPEVSKTVTLAAGENEIVFTYTKIIKPTSSATANYINHTPADYNNATWPLTDGRPVAFGNGIYYFNGNQNQTAPIFELVFSFDKVYAFDAMTAYWSTNDTKVDVYVSDSTENWGDPVYSGTTPQTATAAATATVKTPLKVSEVDLGGAEGQYIKVVFNKGMDSQIYEITFEGGEPAAEPETPSFAENVIVNGAQIRLPDDGVKAGIRFGATLSPDLVGDVNNFAFDPAGDVKVGMFIIPVDLLGGMTFENYLVANDYEGQALKVVAEHIYKRDETKGITYTAVLTEIPASGYDKEITAIPYVCVNGEYQFAEQAEAKTYRGVAAAIYADYEAGEITLNDTQLGILTEIIG